MEREVVRERVGRERYRGGVRGEREETERGRRMGREVVRTSEDRERRYIIFRTSETYLITYTSFMLSFNFYMLRQCRFPCQQRPLN